jgi:formiminotetrahydrofolate cyclodeaminase
MKLSEMTVKAFADMLASDAPAPGGGSAAALAGAIGAGLTAMVACLTQGRKQYADYAVFAAEAEERGNMLKARLLNVMDQDTEAFNLVSAAFALPKETDEEKSARSAAIQKGLKACTETPLLCMELCAEAITLSTELLEHGFNTSSASDLGVAFLQLGCGIRGAWLNVLINIGSIKDEDFVTAARAKGETLLTHALPLAVEGYEKILALVSE